MMNLNDNFKFNSQAEFNLFNLKLEDYSAKFEVYEKLQQRNINTLREHTGRSLNGLTTRDIKPTDKFIYQEELNLKSNREKLLILKKKVVEMEKYIHNIGDGDNFDKFMDHNDELDSSLAPFSNTEYPFPSVIPSDSPFVHNAIMSLYIQNKWINGEFAMLDAQRIRLSETVSAELDTLNEPQLSDCLGSTLLVEQITTMNTVEHSFMGNNTTNSSASMYPTCDIYLGYQYCV